MKLFRFVSTMLLILFTCSLANAVVMSQKQARITLALRLGGMPGATGQLVLDGMQNVYYYDTAVELAAATPTDGVIGYAIDTDAWYFRAGSAWTGFAVAGNLTVAGTAVITGATTSTGAFTASSTSAHTGDATFSGGAGAITLDDSASSVVLIDNDASALDIGSAGKLDMVRFNTSNDAESVDFRSPAVLTGLYDSFAEGDDKGIATFEFDGTATTGTAALVHHAYLGNGTILGYAGIGGGQAVDIDMTATGLDWSGDQDADNEGREVWSGWAGASGRPFLVGTDPAFYLLTSVVVGDIDGTDTLICGFRRMEVLNADYAAYDTYFGIGAVTSADPMALEVIEELNGGAGASTDTTDTLQDGIQLQIKILISGAGVATALIDADTPGTLEAPDTTSAFTFDDGDLVIPYCHYLEHTAGGYADSVEMRHWEVGYQ